MDLLKEIEDLATNFEACRKTLSAMGDETRQHIILEMMHMDYHGSRVPDITERTNLSHPAVSHHLQKLRAAGLLECRRDGKETYYRAADTELAGLLHVTAESVMRLAGITNATKETTR